MRGTSYTRASATAAPPGRRAPSRGTRRRLHASLAALVLLTLPVTTASLTPTRVHRLTPAPQPSRSTPAPPPRQSPATPATATATATAPATAFAIIGARIVDGTGRPPFDGTVVVRDGRIAAVGADVPVPAGLPTIDGRGRTLTPGLFDLHVHLLARASNPVAADLGKQLAAYLYCGVTSVAELGSDPESFAPFRELLASGTLRGPHVSFAARMAVPGGHGAEAGRADLHTALVVTPRDADAAVRRLDPYQPDLIKVFADGWRYGTEPDLPGMEPRTLATIARGARTRTWPVFTHTVTAAGAREAMEAGVTTLAHGIGDATVVGDAAAGKAVDGRGSATAGDRATADGHTTGGGNATAGGSATAGSSAPASGSATPGASASAGDNATAGGGASARPTAAAGSSDARADASLPREMREHGMTYVSTLSVYEPREHRRTTPLLWNVVEPAHRKRLDVPPSAPGDDPISVARRRRWAHLLRNLIAMRRAGVRLGVGTDAGMPSAPHGWSTLLELRLLVEGAGLTPLEAITAATGDSAAALGVEADRGTIAPGRRADLVLIDGDPTTDVARMEQITRVFLDGREVDRPALEAMMTSDRPSPLAPVAVTAPLIDDFEGPDDRSDRGSRWMNATDAGPHTTRMVYGRVRRTAPDRALQLSARMSDDDRPFARVWLAMVRGGLQPADVSAFRGLRFQARGDGTYRLVLATRAVRDGRFHEATFRGAPAWTTVEIPFARFTQPGKGTPAPWTGRDLLELAFEVARPAETTGWLEIDNVRFY